MAISLFRQKATFKWSHFCYEQLIFKRVNIVRPCIQNAAQYCTSIKDKNKNISEDYENINRSKYEDINRLNDITKEFNNKTRENNQFQKINKESLIQKKVERLYPQPKTSIMNIYALVSQELNDHTVLTSKYKQIKNKPVLWQVSFDVKWPETMSFSVVNRSKSIASKNAALKCLLWLEMKNKLKYGKPIIYTTDEIKQRQLKPVELSVNPEALSKMVDMINIYDTEIQNTMTSEKDIEYPVSYKLHSSFIPIHPLLEKNVKDPCNPQIRNEILKQRLLNRQNVNTTLPIYEFRNEILSKLQDNRVLLIEGDTGCGKTTQVPQFIMDNFVHNNNATDCNILVSQPRRISAISLADRIAAERNEKVGDVVGFHVRLEQVLPSNLGGILLCTTGILLKKLQSNPGLLGCSHVILDEAHERHVDIDILMILLKRALKLNPNLRILIMSATINTHLFQQYFDCPSVKIPGRLHPVQMHFLEDIQKLPDIQKYQVFEQNHNIEKDKIMVNFSKTVQVIKWISQHKPPGAILCFLPGWNEIVNVQTILENTSDSNQCLILPIHSKMSHNEQRKIFEHTPPNTRKIILATDIAETGITVSDVIYVVDSAIRKELRWDSSKDLPNISNCWISQANIKQRKGRAGRVKPGESYHLITRKQYNNLEPHPLPQILCSPLEKVVLDSKTYTNEKAEEFLSALIEPPNPIAIQKAVSYLIDLDILDDKENLTALGKRLSLFPTHPKISKALVYSAIFNCIHPVTTIASILSGEDNIFFGLLDNKVAIRENKRMFHPSSDHIALAWIFKQWITYNDDHNLVLKFCKQMKLRQKRMEVLSQIRNTFIQQLIQCRMLSNQLSNIFNHFDIAPNKYENDDELIRALLYSATQQLIEHKTIGFKNGIVRTINQLQTNGRARAIISGESVNYKRKLWPSSFITYFHSAHCETRRSTVIRESSLLTPLSVLLFSQGETQYRETSDGNLEIIVKIKKGQILRFSCDEETADVLLRFRDIMWSLIQFSLKWQGFQEYDTDQTTKVFQYKDKFLDILTIILGEAARSIEEADFDEKKLK